MEFVGGHPKLVMMLWLDEETHCGVSFVIERNLMASVALSVMMIVSAVSVNAFDLRAVALIAPLSISARILMSLSIHRWLTFEALEWIPRVTRIEHQ